MKRKQAQPKFAVGDRVTGIDKIKGGVLQGIVKKVEADTLLLDTGYMLIAHAVNLSDKPKLESPAPHDFEVGDYVSGWSIKAGTGRAQGTVERIGNKYLMLDGDHAVLILDAKREPKPEGAAGHHVTCNAAEDESANPAAPNLDSIKLGDRVTFQQHWYGELHQFEGTVQALNGITALVNYEVPVHLDDGVERVNQIESAIATFALAKVAEVLPPEYSESDQIRAQIAAIKAEGAIAPDHCWIEQWKRAENFVEVRYKARTAIFPGKRGGMVSSQYVGKRGSPAHSAALDAVDRRNRIAKLQKQLEKEKC